MSRLKRRIPIAAPVLAGILLLAGGLYLRYGRRHASGTLVASGALEMTEVSVSPKSGGKLAQLLVDEGDVVRRGQLLARLDTAELDARVAEASAAVAAADARLADLERGARPEELAAAEADLARAEAAYRGADATARTAGAAYAASTELKQQVDAAAANLCVARAQYAQAGARLALLEAGARPEELAQARAALDAARARLALVRKGPRAEEQDEGRAAVANAQAALTNAETSLHRFQTLFAGGAVSRQQVDDAVTARDRARANLDAANARLRVLLAGSRDEEREQAEAEVRRLDAQVRLLEAGARREDLQAARAERQRAAAAMAGAESALANARLLYRDRFQALSQREGADTEMQVSRRQVDSARARLQLLRNGATAEAIAAARAARDQARAALAQARSRRRDAEIYAPVDGIVAEKVREAGETVNAGQSIVTLTNPDDTWVKVYLPVTSLGRVGVGARAQVRVDAFPGRAFPGRVTEVSQIPEFTPKNVQTQDQRVQLVFWVKVALANQDRALKPGLPADALFPAGGDGRGK